MEKNFFPNFDDKKTIKNNESKALAEAMVAERDLVIDTLLEIERICEDFQDKKSLPTTSNTQSTELFNNNNNVDCCSCNNTTDTLFNNTFEQIIIKPSLKTQVSIYFIFVIKFIIIIINIIFFLRLIIPVNLVYLTIITMMITKRVNHVVLEQIFILVFLVF